MTSVPRTSTDGLPPTSSWPARSWGPAPSTRSSCPSCRRPSLWGCGLPSAGMESRSMETVSTCSLWRPGQSSYRLVSNIKYQKTSLNVNYSSGSPRQQHWQWIPTENRGRGYQWWSHHLWKWDKVGVFQTVPLHLDIHQQGGVWR